MLQARYDANGDIILMRTAEEIRAAEEEMILPVTVVPVVQKITEETYSAWTLIQEIEKPAPVEIPAPVTNVQSVPAKKVHAALPSSFSKLHEKSKQVIANGTLEGKSQLTVTITGAKMELDEAKKTLASLPHRVRGGLRQFWKSANKPVGFMNARKSDRKPRTRVQQFVIDTIRFGGTFAGIFVVLFVGINYQSFLSIASAELAFGGDIKTQQALEQIVNGTSGDPLNSNTMNVFRDDGDVLAYLPPVGPFEDRLIIPKLGENVPIVRPSMAALMKEDWKKFEDDIQEALHDGVVHYPGSAKPGQAGNFFVTGHSSYYPWDNGRFKDVFARLSQLELGDTYSVYYGGDRHTYRVTGKKEVRPSDTSVLDQPTDKRIATLMTCTPVGTTLRRLIVTAEEIDPATGEILKVGEKTTDQQYAPVARLESLPI